MPLSSSAAQRLLFFGRLAQMGKSCYAYNCRSDIEGFFYLLPARLKTQRPQPAADRKIPFLRRYRRPWSDQPVGLQSFCLQKLSTCIRTNPCLCAKLDQTLAAGCQGIAEYPVPFGKKMYR